MTNTPTLESQAVPDDIIKVANQVVCAWKSGGTEGGLLMLIGAALFAERQRSQWQPIVTVPWHKEVLVYSEEGGTGVLLAQFTSLRGLISESEVDELSDQGLTEEELDANAWFYCDFGGGARLEAECAPSRWMHLPNEEPKAEVAPPASTDISHEFLSAVAGEGSGA